MRATKALFQLADLCAWMLFSFALLVAIAHPFYTTHQAKLSGVQASALPLFGTSLLCLLLAAGALLVTRRRASGLLLMIPAACLLGATPWLCLLGALIFAAPFALAWREAGKRVGA